MRQMKVVSALLLLLAAGAALAHAHLQKTVPASGAELKDPPSNIVLTFSEPTKLTACWLEKTGEPSIKIGGLPDSPAREISVPVPQLKPGAYVLSWRMVGDDGHVTGGQLKFSVATPAAAPSH
jgi:methionine-rich copper-binding protein CopC